MNSGNTLPQTRQRIPRRNTARRSRRIGRQESEELHIHLRVTQEQPLMKRLHFLVICSCANQDVRLSFGKWGTASLLSVCLVISPMIPATIASSDPGCDLESDKVI